MEHIGFVFLCLCSYGIWPHLRPDAVANQSLNESSETESEDGFLFSLSQGHNNGELSDVTIVSQDLESI